jgi:hypothetical protein
MSPIAVTPKVRARITERDGRTWVRFDQKPSEELRRSMKAEGWQWSPRRGAWSLLTQ